MDVEEDGTAVLQDGRLYQLIRQDGEVYERTLEVVFLEPGAQAYVFTFLTALFMGMSLHPQH